MKKNKLVHLGIITIFCSLYFLVATISMINSVAFFDLAHNGVMNWSLAIGFELGAAASLAAIIILDKTNRFMVWTLFLLLTAFQMMANSYHAFVNLEAYMGWIELFGLQDMEPIAQKRVLSIVSGAILPIVALGFIKSLVDYIRPENASNKPTEKVSDLFNKKPEPIQESPFVPSESQIKKVKKDQVERIKAKTPIPEPETVTEEVKDDFDTIPEANPVPVNITPTPPPPAPTAGPERAISEAIKKKQLEEIEPTIENTPGDVEVTIKDNITYVKTKKKDE